MQEQLVEQEPERFFRPPYVGGAGLARRLPRRRSGLGRGGRDLRRRLPSDRPEEARRRARRPAEEERDVPTRRHDALDRRTPRRPTCRPIIEGLGGLPAAIAEIRDYRFGPDAEINEGNFDFVVVADFESAEDYLVYRDHPVHRALIAERIAPHLAERAAVQYYSRPDQPHRQRIPSHGIRITVRTGDQRHTYHGRRRMALKDQEGFRWAGKTDNQTLHRGCRPGATCGCPGRGRTFVRELAGPPGAPVLILLHGGSR